MFTNMGIANEGMLKLQERSNSWVLVNSGWEGLDLSHRQSLPRGPGADFLVRFEEKRCGTMPMYWMLWVEGIFSKWLSGRPFSFPC